MPVKRAKSAGKSTSKSKSSANGHSHRIPLRANAGRSIKEIQSGFIPCEFYPGMFSDEWAVTIKISDQVLSLFAKKSEVREIDSPNHKGQLRVKVWDAKGNIVALPSETIEQGRRYLEYPVSQLAIL